MNNFSASEERRQEPESPTQQLDDHGNNVENIGPTTPEASGQCFCPSVTAHNSDISQQSVILYTPLWNIINQHCLS